MTKYEPLSGSFESNGRYGKFVEGEVANSGRRGGLGVASTLGLRHKIPGPPPFLVAS